MNVLIPQTHYDRTELPILNNFPLGSFLSLVYLICLPRLWQHIGITIENAFTNIALLPATASLPPGAGLHSSNISPVVDEDFSRDVVETLGQANVALAQLLAGTFELS